MRTTDGMNGYDSGGYSSSILDHARNPHNAGEIADPDARANREHPACGDRLEIQVRLCRDAGEPTVEEIGFRASACAGTFAAASVATMIAKGKTASFVLTQVTAAEIDTVLGGFPPGKAHCSRLAAAVLKEAVQAAVRRGLDRSTAKGIS